MFTAEAVIVACSHHISRSHRIAIDSALDVASMLQPRRMSKLA